LPLAGTIVQPSAKKRHGTFWCLGIPRVQRGANEEKLEVVYGRIADYEREAYVNNLVTEVT
jgi:hypothetical protein